MKKALSILKGAFAFVILTEDEMMVAHDPNGLRPLSLGKLGDAWVVASETCAFDLIGAEFVRSVEPGELLLLMIKVLTVRSFCDKWNNVRCVRWNMSILHVLIQILMVLIFIWHGNVGKQLANEVHIEADVVTGVPDSSISAAIGFSEESGIPYELGFIKNRYVGRTFIQPSQELRERGVKMKLSPVVQVVKGKRVVMVDDSIVRGTTSQKDCQYVKRSRCDGSSCCDYFSSNCQSLFLWN